jgi:catechol 2,3-dioxygenase-like lactoylglutathione lyase family enzyme
MLAMPVQALGYVGFGADNLDDWSTFATGQLGLQPVDHTASCRTFRMDDRRQRLIVDAESAQRFYGWEVADAASLDALAARLDAAGVAVRRETASRTGQRFVSELTPPDPSHMPPPPPGRRAPVIEGNYHRMSGICPWWDATLASA